jgi:hypothetical protein
MVSKRLYIAIAGIITSFVGVMTILGYSLGLPQLYQWSNNFGYMAINTAVCFVLVGWALVTIAFTINKE